MSEHSFHLPKPDRRGTGVLVRMLRWLLTAPDWVARLFCSEDVYQEPLDGHGVSYFGELLSQYENLGVNRRNHPDAENAIRDIRERARESDQIQHALALLDASSTTNPEKKQLEQKLKRCQLTWDDLVRFESAMLQVVPELQLRRRAASIRDEYREVVGEEAWKRYLENKPPELAGAIDVLRADAEALLSELHWRYISEPVQECQRARLLFTVLFGMIYMAIGLGLVWGILALLTLSSAGPLAGAKYSIPIIVGVMFAGGFGGSFSSLIRLQRTSLAGNAVVNLWKLDFMGVSAILSPFVGATSAILLLLLFTGHFVEGQLFPKISLVKTSEICSAGIGGTNSTSSISPAADEKSATPGHTISNAAAAIPFEAIGTNSAVDTPEDATNASAKKVMAPTEKNQTILENPWPYHIYISCGVELAKLLIWCFIAGFSERLVPDIIDRLGEKAKS